MKDLAFAIADTLSYPQNGAYADVEVRLGMVKLLHKRYDFCKEA